jgi:hypothetical protein
VANGKAEKYRERAKEFRELAAQTKNDSHRKLLLETAEKYEKMAENECKRS